MMRSRHSLRRLLGPGPRAGDRPDSGTSLAEMAVTTAILAIIISTSGVTFDSWMRTARTNQERTVALQEGRMIGDRISKEIRMATGQAGTSYMATTPNSCTVNPRGLYSNLYTLVEAGPSSVAFYKVPSEGRLVRIRFSRAPDNQMYMATKEFSPSNPTQEMTTSAGVTTTRVVVNGVANSTPWIFQYMSDTVSPLPTDSGGYLGCRELTQVGVVNIVLYVDQDPNLAIGASTIETSVFIRSAGFWK